jgi:hypothetical protein
LFCKISNKNPPKCPLVTSGTLSGEEVASDGGVVTDPGANEDVDDIKAVVIEDMRVSVVDKGGTSLTEATGLYNSAVYFSPLMLKY